MSTDPTAEPILDVRNLQTTFFTEKETIRAVDGVVSFDIRPGETVGVVGERLRKERHRPIDHGARRFARTDPSGQ